MAWGIVGMTTVLALAVPSWASDKDILDGQEMAFLRQRAQDDVMMWKLGEYAAEHAATDRVKHLGQAIVEERRTDLRDIQKMAQDHGSELKVPETLDAMQRTNFDRMTREGGVNFDKQYTKEVMLNYDAAIPQLERERDHAAHIDVREYAGKNLTMFKDHNREAHDAQSELGK